MVAMWQVAGDSYQMRGDIIIIADSDNGKEEMAVRDAEGGPGFGTGHRRWSRMTPDP